MNKKKKIFSLFLAVVLCLVFPIISLASERSITPRFTMGWSWGGDLPRTVTFYCGFSSKECTAIRSAMSKWNAVKNPDGGKMINLALSTDSSKYNPNEIVYTDSYYDWVGYTNPELDGNEIIAADIWLGNEYSWSVGGTSSSYDIQTVVQHELGHVLGVAHCHEKDDTSKCYSSTCAKNVMNPLSKKGSTRTVLQEYDKSSYILLYCLS